MESEDKRQELLEALRAQLRTVQHQRTEKQGVLTGIQREVASLFLDERRIQEQIELLSSSTFAPQKEAEKEVRN